MTYRKNSDQAAAERAERREYSEISEREDGRVSARFNPLAASDAESEMIESSSERWNEVVGGCGTAEGY
jgi:hypothetical protein